MYINCRDGDFRRCWKRMIDFQIKVDPRILQAILPEIEKMFARASKTGSHAYACPNPLDEDFVEAWESGLKEEFLNDRKALARLYEIRNLNMDISRLKMKKRRIAT